MTNFFGPRRTRSAQPKAAAILVLLTVTACGGGEAAPAKISMSLSTSVVTVAATTAEAAPTAKVVVQLSFASARGLYLEGRHTGRGVLSMSLQGASPSSAEILVTFRPPAAVGPGTYEDTLTLAVCWDKACTDQVVNSPQVVRTTYTVGAVPLSVSTASPDRAVAGSDGIVVAVEGTGFYSASSVLWNGSARPTTFVSPTRLEAAITRDDLASAGSVTVTVVNGGAGGQPPAGVPFLVEPDLTAPAVPRALTAIATSTGVMLGWSPSTDDARVAGYRIYREGAFLLTVTGNAATDQPLHPRQTACYAVTAIDPSGNESARSDGACASVPDAPPVAVLDGPSASAVGGEAVFDATASHDPDGSVISYTFDFGDGSAAVTQASPLARHVYGRAGTYQVQLIVTDEWGATGAVTADHAVGIEATPVVDVSRSPHDSASARIARNEAGLLDVIWIEASSQPLLARSVDGGGTFGTATNARDPTEPPGATSGATIAAPVVAVSGGDVHVAWLSFGWDATVFGARSRDGGATFEAPEALSSGPGVAALEAAIAAGAGGWAAVAWAGNLQPVGTPITMVSVRASGSAAFSAPLPLEPGGRNPTIARSPTAVHVAWSVADASGSRILASRSMDGGATFSTPVAIDAVHASQDCPRLAVDQGGTVYVAWLAADLSMPARVVASRSDDGGRTFSAPVPVSSPTVYPSCPRIAAGEPGRVTVAWNQLPGGPTGTPFLVTSSDGGGSFSAPIWIPLPVDAGWLDIAAVPSSGVDVVWEGPGPVSGGDVYFAHIHWR